MNLYTALNQMRELSEKEIPFSFSFMSYSRTRQTTEGIVEVRRAKLIRRAKMVEFENAEIIEPYYDLDRHENRRFYQCTLMTFNGHRLSFD